MQQGRLSVERAEPKQECRTEAQRLVEQYLSEVAEALKSRLQGDAHHAYWTATRLTTSDLASGREILSAPAEVQVAILRVLVARSFPSGFNRDQFVEHSYANRRIGEVANQLTRRKLAYTSEDVGWLLERVAGAGADWRLLEFSPVSIQSLLRSIERWSRDNPLPDLALVALKTLRDNIQSRHFDGQGVRALALISDILEVQDDKLLDTGDDWGHEASQALNRIPGGSREAWLELLALAGSIRGARPTQKWQRETAEHIAQLGPDVFVGLASAWFELLNRRTRGSEYRRADGFEYPSAYIADRNADLLRGLAWACASVGDDKLTVVLGDTALACYKKIPGYGARSTKGGNACVLALAAMASLTAIGQLQRLRERVKLASQRNVVEEALAAAANERGLSAEDLDELFVSAFDLQDGAVRRQLGDFTAELIVSGSNNVELRWLTPDGKAQKTVPAEIKRAHADEVKVLKRTQKELCEALTAQRARIERLMISEREWSVADWRERYLDHPLLSLLVRRLLWTFEQDGRACVGGWLNGEIIGLDDQSLACIRDDAHVRLWHPIEAGAEEVLAWREWLERHEVTQPFKQAHREIYVLTDAERETETYSNRFAAHVIRQHQFNALCQQRGWRYQLQGAWDSFNVPTLALHEAGLRAEYWVEGIDQGEGSFSHAGIYLYATTDQVRFADLQSGESIPLEEVPAQIFSEVMRDVDLFVGVASIGADPHWLDGGENRLDGHQNYWWDFSFGELTARAEVRRETLARLLPRMAKLADRWAFDGRFLRVRGDLRSYKIHLGSGNILMEPNDQYLCIVPGRGAGGARSGDGLFLPFEGDQTLAVILSKALLLAEDTKIMDPTIVRQIGGAD